MEFDIKFNGLCSNNKMWCNLIGITNMSGLESYFPSIYVRGIRSYPYGYRQRLRFYLNELKYINVPDDMVMENLYNEKWHHFYVKLEITDESVTVIFILNTKVVFETTKNIDGMSNFFGQQYPIWLSTEIVSIKNISIISWRNTKHPTIIPRTERTIHVQQPTNEPTLTDTANLVPTTHNQTKSHYDELTQSNSYSFYIIIGIIIILGISCIGCMGITYKYYVYKLLTKTNDDNEDKFDVKNHISEFRVKGNKFEIALNDSNKMEMKVEGDSDNVDFGYDLLKATLSCKKRKELIAIFSSSKVQFLEECKELGLSEKLTDKMYELAAKDADKISTIN